MGIDEILLQIITARYGRDVRQAIHDGIKQAYDDAIKNGNANMEVSQARGSYPTLAKRLSAELKQLLDDLNNRVVKGQVGMEELTQEVKEALTGGSVAVVGTGAINTSDKMVDGVVTLGKLEKDLQAKSNALNFDNDTYAFSVTDSEGKVGMAIDRDGKLIVTGAKISEVDFTEGDYPFSIVDSEGKLAFAISSDGEVISSNSSNESSSTKTVPFNHSTEISMFIAYGQSWSTGYDTKPISITQPYGNLMLDTGIMNAEMTDYTVTATSFVPLVERLGKHTYETGYQILGETPVSGQANMVMQLLSDENNVNFAETDYVMLGTAPGKGSTFIPDLAKGTEPYARLIGQVQKAYEIAQSQGKALKVEAFSWTQYQGSYADYSQDLENLRLSIETDVKVITGQKEPVKCITWQAFPTNEGQIKEIYNRSIKASKRFPNIVVASPTYHLETISKENVHLTAKSSMWLGAYYGKAFKREINDGIDFEPLQPINIDYQGKIALITFNAQNQLVFDSSQVSPVNNYGFQIKTSDGTEKAISSVKIISPNTVKIVSSTDLVETDRIIYGDVGTGWGGIDGKHGNLRDTSEIAYRYGDYDLPLHDWSVVFDLTPSELKGE